MKQKRHCLFFLAGMAVGGLLSVLLLAGTGALRTDPGPSQRTDLAAPTEEADLQESRSARPEEAERQESRSARPEEAETQESRSARPEEAERQEDRSTRPEETGTQEDWPAEGKSGGEEAFALWDAATAYTGGAEVCYENGIYRAKWWTQNEVPERSAEGVWEYLGERPPGFTETDGQNSGSEEKASAGDEGKASAGDKKKASGKGGQKTEESSGLKIVAYYPSWKEGEENLSRLRFDSITHVNYAFAIPTAGGELRPLENGKQAKEIIRRAHAAGAKALLSVGGWSCNDVPLEGTFMEATETPEKRERLVEAILYLCDSYDFDGVDMDWEHPRMDGTSKQQYEALMLRLSEKLHAEGKLITAAVLPGVTADGLVYYDAPAHTDRVLEAVDWINVMAYDGGDGERHSTYEFAAACAAYWKDTRKVPGEKIVLGVPFYARPSWADYRDILAADPEAWKKDVSDYNGMQVWYNGCDTVRKKAAYAKENLGGIMIWEITQDTIEEKKNLLSAVRDGLGF